MKKINAEIIADSIDPRGNRITSMLLTIPQIVVKELLRHRMFSFSSSSMRAIPFNKVLQDTKENMFVPIAFQSHHTGMQGTEYLTGVEEKFAKEQWIRNGILACNQAEDLYNLGVTKQLCSRIIEPFGYAQILVTATTWENFFDLRCPKYPFFENIKLYKSKKDVLKSINQMVEAGYEISIGPMTDIDWLKSNKSSAEIHIQALAEIMWDKMNESTPQKLNYGEWHIPFGDRINTNELHDYGIVELDNFYDVDELKLAVATARCARLSYATFDGEIDYRKDIKLHNQLITMKHKSPFEHIVRVMTDEEYASFRKGQMELEWLNTGTQNTVYASFGNNYYDGITEGWCNNLRGFISYRYLIENNGKI